MTPDERNAVARALCEKILSTPLPFALDVRAGTITPSIPALILRPDFTKGRPRRRRRPSPASVHQLTFNFGNGND